MRTPITHAVRDDRGVTLVELMIYSALMLVIITIAGAILGSALRGQRDIAASSSGTNAGQLVAQSISTGVRSATEITVKSVNSTTQMLIIRTPGLAATASARCQAWYFTTDNGGAVYSTTSASSIPTPTAAQLATWTKLTSGILLSPRSGAPTAILTADATPTRSITFEWAMANASAQPIIISSTASTRQSITGSTSCV